MLSLRPYQQDSFDKLREAAGRHKRILVVAPTGSGKTVVASHIIKQARDKLSYVLFIAHRKEIIDQTSDKLNMMGIDHGVIMSKDPRKSAMTRVQVASIQTLIHRDFPLADLIIVDESHHIPSKSYQKIIKNYPDAHIIGLTATPCRADGKGLGNDFDCLLNTISTAELQEQGYLVKTRVFAPSVPDLRKIKTVRGDFDEKELDTRVNQPKMIGDIVEHWENLAENRPTVCFALSISHSTHIVEAFVGAGVRAEHLDGETPKYIREEILARLKSGETQIVSNVAVLQEGWDMPECSCIILARPTKSYGLYLQMVGRSLRPSEGKKDTLILDHSGATYTHGFVDEKPAWSLDTKTKVQDRILEQREAKKDDWKCQNCFFVNKYFYKHCAHCGLKPSKQAKGVVMGEGELIEVKKAKRKKVYSMEDKTKFYRMLLSYTRSKGQRDGAASWIYRAKFGCWPAKKHGLDSMEPNQEVKNYIKYYNIKRAKARGKMSAVV